MAAANVPAESAQASRLFTSVPSAFLPPLATPTSSEANALSDITHDRKIDNIILDIGDVLFTWSANTDCSVSPGTLRRILYSTTWFEFEKGNIDQEETYRLLAQEFSLDPSEVSAALRAASDTLQINDSMFSFLHELKRNSDIRLFAMSNISAPDWEVLRQKARPEDWALFDQIFTSAAVHERKPDLGYFRHVLESTGIDPRRTAFVDDKLENVVPAQSLGLKGIVFTSLDDVVRELRTLLRNQIVDGEKYLRNHAKQMHSVTNTGVIMEETIAQLLILEATGDPSLVDYTQYPRLWNFFKSTPVLTTPTFPHDLDTSSLAYTILDHNSLEVKNDVMDEMLKFKNKDGIMQTYFDVTRPRVDPTICINILTFFHANGRGSQVHETFDWVHAILRNRAYANGTLYYYGPDTFLFFLSRLLSRSADARQRLGALFAKRVTEQFGAPGDALALAMRIHAGTVVDVCDARDCARLARMQEADGSWPMGWVYRYGVTGILIGNKGMTTALAVSAIRRYRELELRLRSLD